MRILLGTQVLPWWLDDNLALSAGAGEAVSDGNHVVFVSSATIWEMVIKRALGKLQIPADWVDVIDQDGFRRWPIPWDHALHAARLPDYHRDPLDRVLAAQAVVEDLVLVTGDNRLARYPAAILHAGELT